MKLACCALLVCAALVGCGDEDPQGPYAPSGGARDAGERDGASAFGDAGGYDHVIRAGDVDLCGFDERDRLELVGNAVRGEVAIANDERGFSLVFRNDAGELSSVDVPAGAEAGEPEPVATGEDAIGAVAVASAGERVLLAFRGEDDDTLLRTRLLRAADDEALTLTESLARSPGGGELFALLGLEDDFVAAFVEGVGDPAASDDDGELRVQRIGGDGMPDGEPSVIDGVAAREPEDVHLSRLDGGDILLAWFERDAAGDGHVFGLVLSTTLEAAGEPIELSRYEVAQARFDLAARRLSAGLVYQAKDGDARDTVKFRRVDGDGQVTQAALNVVNAPGRAVGGSIAAFGQGYAVAYRVLASLGVEHAAIRVAFINQFGAIVYEAELATTSEQGGRTTIAATADGHLLVGWSDVAGAMPATRGLQLYCPGALKLCGGAIE